MKMQVHELHPAVVHAPLTLLPAATVADLISLAAGDRAWARVGRSLWTAGTLSAALAGVAGLAASQEVKMDDPQARRSVFVHGLGNALILVSAIGVTAWRRMHRPSATVCALGAVACSAAVYTAWLGGEMVYAQGVGVKSMPAESTRGARPEAPPLFSKQGPSALLRDALAGVRWLLGEVRDTWRTQVPAGVERAKGLLHRNGKHEAPYAPAHGSTLPQPNA